MARYVLEFDEGNRETAEIIARMLRKDYGSGCVKDRGSRYEITANLPELVIFLTDEHEGIRLKRKK